MRLRLRIRPDAFGNALGWSLAEAAVTPIAPPSPSLVDGLTFSETLALQRAAGNPHRLPTVSDSATHGDVNRLLGLMSTPYENTEMFLDSRGSGERLSAGPAGVMANPFRGQGQSAFTRLLDTAITGRGATRAEEIEQRLTTIKDLLGDVRKDQTYVAAELRNVVRMQNGELGWLGKFFAAPQAVNGLETPSRIEVAVGSILNSDALTFGSVMSPLVNPFAMRSNGNAMGGMLAMLSLADPDAVVNNLRSMTNAEVVAPGGESMYAFDFAARRDTSAGLLSFLGSGPAMAAGNATSRLISSSLTSTTESVQSALASLRSNLDVRSNPFMADHALSRGSVLPPSVLNQLKSGPYGPLLDELRGTGLQAHHLNQNAAFQSVIPKSEGAAVGLRGNAFTEVGSQHYNFHSSLEGFWNQYRRGGASFGGLPTNAEYAQAVQNALRSSGMSPAEVARLSAEAAQNRAAFGLQDHQSVPNLPGRLGQRRP